MKINNRLVRRVLLQSLLWLAFGAAMTICVAWCHSIMSFPNTGPNEVRPSLIKIPNERGYWLVVRWRGSGCTLLCVFGPTHYDPGPDWIIALPEIVGSTELSMLPQTIDVGNKEPRLILDQRGFPFIALFSTAIITSDSVQVYGGFRTPRPARRISVLGDAPVVLPFEPIWGNFILDSAIYAWTGWLLLCSLKLVTVMIRRRSGKCAYCGYDLRGTSGTTCSECGHAIAACAK